MFGTKTSKIALAGGLLLASFTCTAGDESYRAEIAGYGGMQHFPGVTKALLGGAIGSPVGRRSLLFLETGYIPMGGGDKILNVAGGLNVGIDSHSDRWTPYVTVLGGLGRAMGGGAGQNNATYGAGAGFRYFAGRNWGIRPEVRWQRYQASDGGTNTYVFSAGLFYRFGTR